MYTIKVTLCFAHVYWSSRKLGGESSAVAIKLNHLNSIKEKKEERKHLFISQLEGINVF